MTQGGEKQHVFESDADIFWPVGDTIYFVPKATGGTPYSIQVLDTKTSIVRPVVSSDRPIMSFTVSPDRRWILYSKDDQHNVDLMLIENFK